MSIIKFGTSRLMWGVIVIMLFSISPSACSYKTTNPDLRISILLEEDKFDFFRVSLFEFANKHGLSVSDSSRSYPTGKNPILIEFTDTNGNRVIKINNLMDEKRFVISFFDCKECDLKPLHTSLVDHIKSSFPYSIQKENF